MEYFFIFCRLLLFLLSNLGLWEYFRRKSGINIYFLPAFTICFQVTVLFLAGILNCLGIAVFAVTGIGIILAIRYLFIDFKNIIHTYCNGGYMFLAISFFVLLFACKGQMFVRYDNFSHWALVVRNMLLTDRYPSFQDTMIIFQEYPLGSVSYVYYFAKIVMDSEAIQMAAQGFMMLSFILPVFKCVKKNVIAAWIYLFVFVNYIFCYNIVIYDLIVDTLLPLQGMAMIYFIYSECLNFSKEYSQKGISPLYAVPFLVTTIQIKNSGIYFVLLAVVLFGLSFRYEKTDVKNNKIMVRHKIFAMIAPFVSLYLWHTHCRYVFLSGAETKHAMTLQNYKNVFSQKTGDDISAILKGVIKFSVSGKDLFDILLFIGILGLLLFFLDSKMRKKYLKLVLVSAVIYVTYMAGMAGMYLFSMPGLEAENLASSDRYRKTILIAIYYIFIIFSLEIISSINNIKRGWVTLIGIYTALLVIWAREGGKGFPVFTQHDNGKRAMVEQVIRDYNVPGGASYLVCAPKEDLRYTWHMCRYILWSADVLWINITDKSQLEKYAGKYEYILNFDDENAYIQEWIKENYPHQEGKTVINQK